MISKLVAVRFVVLSCPSENLVDLTVHQLLEACRINVMHDLADCSLPVIVRLLKIMLPC